MLTLNSNDDVRQTINPRTGHVEAAHWIPDYFGPGRWGVRMQDGTTHTMRDIQAAGRTHRRKLWRTTRQGPT